MPEQLVSLREAERCTGISRQTLRAWLEDAGLCMPKVARGSKILISGQNLRLALALHSPTGTPPKESYGLHKSAI